MRMQINSPRQVSSEAGLERWIIEGYDMDKPQREMYGVAREFKIEPEEHIEKRRTYYFNQMRNELASALINARYKE